MKSRLLFIFGLSIFGLSIASAQVGVGTTAPASSLDVVANIPTGTATTTDGLLIPRITRERARAMTGITTSTLVYVDVLNAGTQTLKAQFIDSVGFYYFDGTNWIKVANSSNDDWKVTGNAGTTAGTNFVGTTDPQDLRFKTQGTDRLNISNTNGQLQSYYAGAAATPAYSWNSDPDTGMLHPNTNELSFTTNGVEGARIRANSNMTIGATFSSANAAPNNGLRVQGQTVINKASGEDARDFFSSHTSATAFSNIVGYPGAAGSRAIAGYAAGAGSMGVLGFAPNNGYGVVGLTQQGTISGFVQTGEGVLGQADGQAVGIPIGVHGIIDEAVVGDMDATPVLGENNTLTTGTGFQGGAYGTNKAIAGTYGNIGSRVASSNTNSYLFGVVGDILTIGTGTIPDGSGGVLGFGGSANFGMLGYRGLTGTLYSVYGGGAAGSVAVGNSGNKASNPANNHIGIGINGGFMGGFIRGNQYGIMAKGDEFGMYVQGNTITNKPIIQLTETENNKRSISYSQTSTSVDITTRGTGNLIKGEVFIPFNENFKSIVSKKEVINVTVTPTAETNGVYISRVTNDGFYVKENKNGESNASFNWVAIGVKSGYEEGAEISEEILDKNYDKNMTDVLINDETGTEEKSIYFDGNKIQFNRIPESQIKYAKKPLPKKQ